MRRTDDILRMALAAVWLLSALASWRYPEAQSMALLDRVGLTGEAARAALYAGITLDALMGLLTLLPRLATHAWLWLGQGMVILAYSLIILIWLPEYAWHPFGALIKNIPLVAILWVLLRSAREGGKHEPV